MFKKNKKKNPNEPGYDELTAFALGGIIGEKAYKFAKKKVKKRIEEKKKNKLEDE